MTNSRSAERSTGTSLCFFCFWTEFLFIFLLKLSIFLMKFFPLLSLHSLLAVRQGGAGTSAACVCQPCRENRHIWDASVQSSSSLLSNCFPAALTPPPAHSPPPLYFSPPSLQPLCHPVWGKCKRFLDGPVTDHLSRLGSELFFPLIVLTLNILFLLTPTCCM